MMTMDINRSILTPSQMVPPAQRYKKAFQFCKAWCSKYIRKWMTYVFVWRSWTERGPKSCKCYHPCMDHDTPQNRHQMHEGMNSRYWYQLCTGLRRRKQHQTLPQCSRPPPWTWCHATSPQLEMHRFLYAWSVECLDYIFPLVAFSYIMSSLSYVSLSGNSTLSKSVSPMG
jgi:hypothetical protein